MRLLLLEADSLLGAGPRDYLRAEGHVAEWCTHLAAAHALEEEPFDAFLVDWQLPDGSGVDWARARRAVGDARPVLLLTARDRLADRILGLDSGAEAGAPSTIEATRPQTRVSELAAPSSMAGATHRG